MEIIFRNQEKDFIKGHLDYEFSPKKFRLEDHCSTVTVASRVIIIILYLLTEDGIPDVIFDYFLRIFQSSSIYN